ncbi:hypothetical protein [Mycoplasma sp. Ms02]|uniref:hypothetical protein n=1 Tax=Mycoplasma sp. Ms02 TaxID=353851 RepID=UPI001C8A6505|nr:hypothetical protein [Mycoplasma sp. Ms02]QZE12259.1 hypothetical protein K4L35_02910 [Mycoplasma sp. Ms02]
MLNKIKRIKNEEELLRFYLKNRPKDLDEVKTIFKSILKIWLASFLCFFILYCVDYLFKLDNTDPIKGAAWLILVINITSFYLLSVIGFGYSLWKFLVYRTFRQKLSEFRDSKNVKTQYLIKKYSVVDLKHQDLKFRNKSDFKAFDFDTQLILLQFKTESNSHLQARKVQIISDLYHSANAISQILRRSSTNATKTTVKIYDLFFWILIAWSLVLLSVMLSFGLISIPEGKFKDAIQSGFLDIASILSAAAFVKIWVTYTSINKSKKQFIEHMYTCQDNIKEILEGDLNVNSEDFYEVLINLRWLSDKTFYRLYKSQKNREIVIIDNLLKEISSKIKELYS